jgi:hypothetical protein
MALIKLKPKQSQLQEYISITVTSQLLSVTYALYAETAGKNTPEPND